MNPTNVKQFLTALDPGRSVWTFQTFDDNDDRKDRRLIDQRHGQFDQHAERLTQLNEQGAGVFVTICQTDGKARKKSNIVGVSAVFVDLDKPGNNPLQQLLDCPLPPHLIVESSPGKYHGYWRVSDCGVEQCEPILAALVKRFDGDPSCVDVARVLRVPGFLHRKGDPFMTRIVRDEPGSMTVAELCEGLALAFEREEPKATPNGQNGELPKATLAKLAAVAAERTLTDPTKPRHGQIMWLGGEIRTAGVVLDDAVATYALKVFESLMRPENAGGKPASMDWDEARRALRHGYTQTEGPQIEWPEPEQLPDALTSVMPFDFALLPKAFRGWVRDVSKRMQCPPDFAAVAVMIMAASIVGRRVGIRPKQFDDWLEVPNLWGAVIGRPGTKKSPTFGQALKPLQRLIAAAQKDYKEAQKDAKFDEIERKLQQEQLEKDYKALLKKGGPDKADLLADIKDQMRTLDEQYDPPRERCYSVNDTSIEKLGEILRDNPGGIMLFRDELTGWFARMEQEQNAADRAFYLEAWNGTSSFRYDRIGRGTVYIKSCCLSVLGGIQPGPFGTFVSAVHKGDRENDGLLQRLQLLVWPDDLNGYEHIDRWPDQGSKDAALTAIERLETDLPRVQEDDLDEEYEGDKADDPETTREIPFVRFSEPAQVRFNIWLIDFERTTLRQDVPEAFEAHLSKYRGLVPALALLCHLIDGGGHEQPVNTDALERAIAWVQYLESHARRVYSTALYPEVAAANKLAEKLLLLPNPFTARDVYRKHWSGLKSGANTMALTELTEAGWVRGTKVDTGGKIRVEYQINPALKKSPRA